MFGYCFGGLLSLLAVAGNPDLPVRSLAVMATPIDFTHMGPMTSMMQEGRVEPADLLDATGNVPADVMLNSFRVLQPLGDVTGYVNLWQNLWNDDFVAAHQVMTQWSRDHIPFPGAAFVQTGELFARQNLLPTGRVPLNGRTIDLADITVPFLNIIGEKDHIVPPEAIEVLTSLVGSDGRRGAAAAGRPRRPRRRQDGPAPQHPGHGRLARAPRGAGRDGRRAARTEVEVRAITAADAESVRRFFARVPEGDRTFFREDVLTPGVVERWVTDPEQHRLVAIVDGEVVGHVAIIQGVAGAATSASCGWSSIPSTAAGASAACWPSGPSSRPSSWG